MFNKNELIIDKVRSLITLDIATGQMLFRLTSLEDPSLKCTAEGEEVTDAIGSVITTLYRAKKATFSASNSIISLDLAAAQFGAEKEIATTENKIVDYTYEFCTVADGKITLKNTPVNDVKFIYAVVNGEPATAYTAGSQVSDTEFTITGAEITVPTGLTGKVFVEYQYETEKAMRISNKASQYPEACKMVVFAYFKDKCNENLIYSGKVVANKAKLNPEQVELALTSTGKHPFEFTIFKDYCAGEDEDELFAIIVAD